MACDDTGHGIVQTLVFKMDDQQKKNRIISLATSVGLHALLLLVFLFMMSLRPPYPPAPEYGIELNFGLDQAGFGDIQPEVPVGTQEETKDDVVATKPESAPQPEVKEEVVQKTLTSDDESSVALKEEKKEIKKVEPVKEKPKEVKPTSNPAAEYTKPTTTDNKTAGSTKEGTPGNQGDKLGTTGDQGNPEGSLNASALYGKQGGGGGGGFALNMSGWSWDETPSAPKLPDNENGQVTFEITVDENGDIVKIETRERSLSPAAEKICKDEILKRSLLKTSAGQAPPFSKGRITFVLRTQ
ncbi:MAG TPA: hypothetical protein VFE57_03915 [Cyclobacteriaceae bacterium]|nr:hypothetical protein [Cyclobacteriaceae bacterium]